MRISFKTWKTIEVDYNKCLPDYYADLKKSSIIMDCLDSEVLDNILKKTNIIIASVNLVKINIYELKKYGTSLFNTNEEILAHFYNLGLHKCDFQTALQLSILFKQKRDKIMLKIITDPILIKTKKFQFVRFKINAKQYLSLVDNNNLTYNFFVPSCWIFTK